MYSDHAFASKEFVVESRMTRLVSRSIGSSSLNGAHVLVEETSQSTTLIQPQDDDLQFQFSQVDEGEASLIDHTATDLVISSPISICLTCTLRPWLTREIGLDYFFVAGDNGPVFLILFDGKVVSFLWLVDFGLHDVSMAKWELKRGQ